MRGPISCISPGAPAFANSQGAGLASGVTRFTVGAVGFCGVLAGVEVADALGAELPHAVAAVAASTSAVIAATVAIRHVVFIWRGPVILGFPRDEAVLCDAREAASIRFAAQLRGTMGGAGYLHPSRLVVSATAWGAVSVQSLALLPPQRTAATFLPLAVLLVAAGLAALLPPAPFFYREASGGCVLVFPPDVCRSLLDRAGVEPALMPIELGMATEGRAGVEAASNTSKSEDAAPRALRDDPSTPV